MQSLARRQKILGTALKTCYENRLLFIMLAWNGWLHEFVLLSQDRVTWMCMAKSQLLSASFLQAIVSTDSGRVLYITVACCDR